MLKQLNYILSKHRLGLLVLFCLILISSLFMSVVSPLLIKFLLDACVKEKNFKLFLLIASIGIFAATMWRWLKYITSLKHKKLQNKLVFYHATNLLRKYFKLPYAMIKEKGPGYYSSIIFEEVKNIVNQTISITISYTESIITFIASFILLLFLSWRITVVLLLAFPVFILISNKLSGNLSQGSKEEKLAEANFRELLQKILKSYKTTKIFNLHRKVLDLTEENLKLFLGLSFKRLKIETLFQTLSGIVSSYQELLILILTAYEVIQGRMTFGGLMAYMQAFNLCINKIGSVVQSHVGLIKLSGYIERIQDYEKDSAAGSIKNNKRFLCASERIPYKVKDVSFAYVNDERDILSDLNYTFEKGKKYLIHGANGSGKSTFINLFSGFLLPTKGTIIGEELNNISASFFPFEFIPGTLKDNVFYEEIDEQKREKFNMLLHEFCLQNYVEDNPENLSAGQKQKFGVVMTLLKEAEVYIFDEPTANLDRKAKKEVIESIIRHTGGKTLLCILHDYDKNINYFDSELVFKGVFL